MKLARQTPETLDPISLSNDIAVGRNVKEFLDSDELLADLTTEGKEVFEAVVNYDPNKPDLGQGAPHLLTWVDHQDHKAGLDDN